VKESWKDVPMKVDVKKHEVDDKASKVRVKAS
jgi:hypothetical protein